MLLPDAIAAHYYKLIFRTPRNFSHIRLANDWLLVPVLALDSFIVEVSKATRKIKTTIYSAVYYVSSCPLNPFSLGLVFRFVIVRKRQSIPFSAKNSSGVASICSVYLGWSNKNYTGRTASAGSDRAIVVTSCIMFFSYDLEFVLSFFTIENIVYLPKNLNQGIRVFLLFVKFEIFQMSHKDFFDKFRYLCSFVRRFLPPCPSKTPKIEFPLPMSSSDMAASSIALRHPEYISVYLAFRIERTSSSVCYFLLWILSFQGRGWPSRGPFLDSYL